MPDLYSYLIPNLIQGVSQQPDAQRDPSQGEIQVNGMSSLSDGLRKRENSHALARLSATALGDVAFHSILRDADERYLVVMARSGLRVFDLAGNEKAVAAPGGYGYLSSTVKAQSDLRAATIADYTFISNTRVAPRLSGATAPATGRPALHEALCWVKAANYGQAYSVNVNGTAVTVTTAVAPVVTNGTTTTENRISAAEIASAIKTGLAAASGVTITRKGSVLHLISAAPISITATDARANADITAITSTVQAFTDLPTIAPRGYQVQITGDPGTKFDGFYVQFVPRSGAGDFGEGEWEETVAPGVQFRLDPLWMPHLLVRLPDGTFFYGPASGQVVQGVTLPTWGERTAGDYDTAPDPSFLGKPIRDVFVYKNRLGFLADESVILSRARDFFEFFPETVTAVLDSDPIDLTASNQKVSVLRYAVPYQDELIIFSDEIQFRFNSSEATLTPETAAITVLTQYEIDPNCRPIQAGGAIIFCNSNGQWAQLREFSVRGAGTALVADSTDLTVYLSSYVPNEVFRLEPSEIGNVWFAISSKNSFRKRIYVHKYYVRNTGSGPERAQSSWSYWELSGADAILNVVCVTETLYLVVQYGDEVWLEKLPVADRASGDASVFSPLLLDRVVTTTTDTPAALRVAPGAYNAVLKQTTWTLPYSIRATTEAWLSYKPGQPGGVFLGIAYAGNKITANGDWSDPALAVSFGELYEFRYRFTRFKLYQDSGGGRNAVNAKRTTIRHAKLRYHATGFFEAVVAAERRPEAVYTFSGLTLGTRQAQINPVLGEGRDLEERRFATGVFSIPVMGNGETTIVELRNRTPAPCRFSTCEWVGMVTGRSRSLQ